MNTATDSMAKAILAIRFHVCTSAISFEKNALAKAKVATKEATKLNIVKK